MSMGAPINLTDKRSDRLDLASKRMLKAVDGLTLPDVMRACGGLIELLHRGKGPLRANEVQDAAVHGAQADLQRHADAFEAEEARREEWRRRKVRERAAAHLLRAVQAGVLALSDEPDPCTAECESMAEKVSILFPLLLDEAVCPAGVSAIARAIIDHFRRGGQPEAPEETMARLDP